MRIAAHRSKHFLARSQVPFFGGWHSDVGNSPIGCWHLTNSCHGEIQESVLAAIDQSRKLLLVVNSRAARAGLWERVRMQVYFRWHWLLSGA